MTPIHRRALALLLGAALAAVALGARAERSGHDERGERGERAGQAAARVPLLPKYQAECGACHLAYPPGMLPAASWARLMGGLPRHFGTDASLDAATVSALSTWLTAHAAGSSSGARTGSPPAPPAPPATPTTPAQDSITQTSWFVRQHRELSPTVWQRVSIKSAANCAACHPQADQGDFNEHQVRIPR